MTKTLEGMVQNALARKSMDDYNYYGDYRVRNAGKNKAPILYLDDGTELELPTRWEVCPTCDGRGSHVNPSIDAGGITAEEMHEDPDFADSYFRGAYDVKCYQCGGRTTVPAVDWDALSPEHRAAYEKQLDDDAAYEAERLAEIRMGC